TQCRRSVALYCRAGIRSLDAYDRAASELIVIPDLATKQATVHVVVGREECLRDEAGLIGTAEVRIPLCVTRHLSSVPTDIEPRPAEHVNRRRRRIFDGAAAILRPPKVSRCGRLGRDYCADACGSY